MGSRRCKDSAEGQGVSCHGNGEIGGQGGDDRGRTWIQDMDTGHGYWAWRPGRDGDDGDRAWRLERAEDNGDWAWRPGTVIRKGLRVRRLAGGRCPKMQQRPVGKPLIVSGLLIIKIGAWQLSG